MRRRFGLVAATLVVSSQVMFMDEPINGLAPCNRQMLLPVVE